MENTQPKKKGLVEWIRNDIRKDFEKLRYWRGGLIGGVAGYIVSFFFQDPFIREKMGLGNYLLYFFDVLFKMLFEGRGFIETALIAWAGVIVGASIGGFVEKKLVEKGVVKIKVKGAEEKPE